MDRLYELQFDGGSRGNPGVAGAGMVLYDTTTGKEVWSGGDLLPATATNNQAEYTALIRGLERALAMGIRNLQIKGDSLLVVNQLKGDYRVKSETLSPLYETAHRLMQQLDSFSIQHIPRAENARADELANQAMDQQASFSSHDA